MQRDRLLRQLESWGMVARLERQEPEANIAHLLKVRNGCRDRIAARRDQSCPKKQRA